MVSDSNGTALLLIRRGLTSFHDRQTETVYGENVAYDRSIHDPEKCRRCLAEKALEDVERDLQHAYTYFRETSEGRA